MAQQVSDQANVSDTFELSDLLDTNNIERMFLESIAKGNPDTRLIAKIQGHILFGLPIYGNPNGVGATFILIYPNGRMTYTNMFLEPDSAQQNESPAQSDVDAPEICLAKGPGSCMY